MRPCTLLLAVLTVAVAAGVATALPEWVKPGVTLFYKGKGVFKTATLKREYTVCYAFYVAKIEGQYVYIAEEIAVTGVTASAGGTSEWKDEGRYVFVTTLSGQVVQVKPVKKSFSGFALEGGMILWLPTPAPQYLELGQHVRCPLYRRERGLLCYGCDSSMICYDERMNVLSGVIFGVAVGETTWSEEVYLEKVKTGGGGLGVGDYAIPLVGLAAAGAGALAYMHYRPRLQARGMMGYRRYAGSQLVFCPNCGSPIPRVALYCPRCGSPSPLAARPSG